MSNVVSFQPKHPPVGAPDLVQLFQTLKAFAVVASVQAEKARTLDKLVGAYANWLRRYYEIGGAVRSAFEHAEEDVRLRGGEADEDRIDLIIDCLAKIETRVKGPHPWLSLPSRSRTGDQIARILSSMAIELTKAVEAAEAIGKHVPRPGSGGAA